MRVAVLLAAWFLVGCGVSFSGEDPVGTGGGGEATTTSTTSTGGTGGTGGEGGTGGTPAGTGAGGIGGSGGAGGDGGQGGQGGDDEPECIVAFEDDFDTLDAWNVEIYGMGGQVQGNGNLVLESGSTQSALVLSKAAFPLTPCGVVAETVQPPTNGGLSWLYLADVVNVTYRVTFVSSGGNLQARIIDGGGLNVLKSEPYDQNAHRWWRLRRTATEVLWDVSPDGQTWTLWHSAPAPVWGAGNNNISLGVTTATANGTVSSFDNLALSVPGDS